jgi:hypothetical protein
MFRQLRVHTPAPLTPNGQRATDQAGEMFVVSLTPAKRQGDQAGSSVEPGAATRPEATLGAMSTAPHLSQAPSYDSATDDDLRRCARCGEQQEYCHGHTPIVPNSSLNLPPQLPVRTTVQPEQVARFNLNHTQATALADRLLNALENHEDATAVLLPYDYRGEFACIVAEGLGIDPIIAAKGMGVHG